MDKGFEKKLLMLMVFATIILGFVSITYAEDEPENQYPGIIRFHVIANSDSDQDQSLKLEVRDYVLERLQSALTEEIISTQNDSQNTLSESQIIRRYIENHLPLIERWASESIAQTGFEYECSANMGIRHIPAKYYDNIYFPEGNYEALTLVIGEGKGQNWWCVVFPPLCLIDSEDSPYQEAFQVDDGDKLILKSKIKELVHDDCGNNGFSARSISNCLSMSVDKIK